MRWALVSKMNEMDYGLEEMNVIDYSVKELGWNIIIEVSSATWVEVRLGDCVMMCFELITEHFSLLGSI